jgi:hypothetical protein
MKNGNGMSEAQKKPFTSVKGFKTIPVDYFDLEPCECYLCMKTGYSRV